MAIPTIKGTYSLDVETIRALERIAVAWGVSKSEALRRMIRSTERAELALYERGGFAVGNG